VLFYYVHKRHNLVFPMISGRRPGGGEEEMTAAPVWRFLLGAGVVSVLVWMVIIGFYF